MRTPSPPQPAPLGKYSPNASKQVLDRRLHPTDGGYRCEAQTGPINGTGLIFRGLRQYWTYPDYPRQHPTATIRLCQYIGEKSCVPFYSRRDAYALPETTKRIGFFAHSPAYPTPIRGVISICDSRIARVRNRSIQIALLDRRSTPSSRTSPSVGS